jgi:hypothetical protein
MIKNAIITASGIVWVDSLGYHKLQKDHPAYSAVEKLVMDKKTTAKALQALIQKKVDDLAEYTEKKITKKNGRYLYKGKELHNTLVTRIKDTKQAGYRFDYLELFIENLFQNPSMTSRESLYDFLEHKDMPITDDGCFLAYKAVRKNYTDKYTGSFDNTPGAVIECDRGDVDDDRSRHCSYGFHVGSIDYVRSYASSYNDRIVVCKVNPKDVVAVPTDNKCQKCRVCRYEVVGELTQEQAGIDNDKVKELESKVVGKEWDKPLGKDYDEYGCGGNRDTPWEDWEDRYLLRQSDRGTAWETIAKMLRRDVQDVMDRCTWLTE